MGDQGNKRKTSNNNLTPSKRRKVQVNHSLLEVFCLRFPLILEIVLKDTDDVSLTNFKKVIKHFLAKNSNAKEETKLQI